MESLGKGQASQRPACRDLQRLRADLISTRKAVDRQPLPGKRSAAL